MEDFSIVNHKDLEGKEGTFLYSFDLIVHIESISKKTEKATSKTIEENTDTTQFPQTLTGKVFLTYPLSVIVKIEIDNVKTLGSLLWKIAQVYKTIYKEEEESAQIKTKPEEERGNVINRNKTDGKYGIWGHDLADLYFEGVRIYENGLIDILIGS